jgi:shikimate kinase
MANSIILIGLMGSGKTTVGKILADKLGKEFVDTDAIIEKNAGLLINKIFQNFGEEYFRNLEENVIAKISKQKDLIISTGGGSVEREINLINLKKTDGEVFYLSASPETLFDRIKTEKNRPLLENNNPLETLKALLKKREAFYLKADFVIDTNNKDYNDVAKEIIAKMKNYEK